MEYLKKFRGIIFDYKKNIFLDHKNLVYVATLSEYQTVMRCWLILKEFGTNIHHIDGVYNIVSDTLSRLPYIAVDKYEPTIKKTHCRANKIFKIRKATNNEDYLPIILLVIKTKPLPYSQEYWSSHNLSKILPRSNL